MTHVHISCHPNLMLSYRCETLLSPDSGHNWTEESSSREFVSVDKSQVPSAVEKGLLDCRELLDSVILMFTCPREELINIHYTASRSSNTDISTPVDIHP